MNERSPNRNILNESFVNVKRVVVSLLGRIFMRNNNAMFRMFNINQLKFDTLTHKCAPSVGCYSFLFLFLLLRPKNFFFFRKKLPLLGFELKLLVNLGGS